MTTTYKWALAALLLAAPVLASSASATSVFLLRDPSIDLIDGGSSFSLTATGVTATLTAYAGGVTDPATVLNRTASGFGVNAVGSGDATDLIDAINGTESVTLSFDQDVFFTQLVLSLYSTPTQVPPGDQASLALPAGTVSPVPTTSATDTYNFAANNFVGAGQLVTLAYVGGNGFSFDSFTVEAVPGTGTNATAVPLPPAAFAGMALLAGLGITRLLRTRHAAR